MDLKTLIVDVKEVWVDFPGLSSFKVKVANLSRKELGALRKDALLKSLIEKHVNL